MVFLLHYDLKTSSNEILFWAIDVILMRKAQYIEFLDYINNDNKISNRTFIHERLWYEAGLTLEDFDNEIELIQNELDKDYRYE